MHKALNTKIRMKYYQLLDVLHKKSDISKARLIEKALDLMASHMEKRSRAEELLEAIEEAEQDFAGGRTKPLDAVLSDIDRKIAARKRISQ